MRGFTDAQILVDFPSGVIVAEGFGVVSRLTIAASNVDIPPQPNLLPQGEGISGENSPLANSKCHPETLEGRQEASTQQSRKQFPVASILPQPNLLPREKELGGSNRSLRKRDSSPR